jgi:hypothetical protein
VATSDQDGLDPTGAQTPEEFMQLLRQASAASGLSVVEIAQRARMRGYDLDPAGLAEALESSTLPSWQTVTGVLTACGMGGMQIDRWIRVHRDLAEAAQPVVPVEPVTAVQEPIDVAPVSVPPLVLTPVSATPGRFGARHFAIAAGALVVLVMAPLLLFTMFSGEPDPVALEATSAPPRTTAAAPPAPSPSDVPSVQPSPTEPAAAPTTPAPVTPTAKPPPRTSSPPPSPPSSPADSGVLRSGTVELSGNDGFDLDSGQREGEVDIRRWDNGLLSVNGWRLARMSGMPGKPACQAVQRWEYGVGDLQPGQWLCVRTSDSRYGRLNITAVGGTLTLTYTVWT